MAVTTFWRKEYSYNFQAHFGWIREHNFSEIRGCQKCINIKVFCYTMDDWYTETYSKTLLSYVEWDVSLKIVFQQDNEKQAFRCVQKWFNESDTALHCPIKPLDLNEHFIDFCRPVTICLYLYLSCFLLPVSDTSNFST